MYVVNDGSSLGMYCSSPVSLNSAIILKGHKHEFAELRISYLDSSLSSSVLSHVLLEAKSVGPLINA